MFKLLNVSYALMDIRPYAKVKFNFKFKWTNNQKDLERIRNHNHDRIRDKKRWKV